MKVAIRADASVELGIGHVVRCLALANTLRAQLNAEVSFLCRPATGDMFDRISWSGFKVFPVHAATPMEDAQQTAEILDSVAPVDWLVVDHYGLGGEWEAAERSARRVMVIDDLAHGSHDCDLLVNQMPVPAPEERYHGLLSPNCRLLAGPEYALMQPAFARVHDQWRPRTGKVGRLLVSFGGTDPPQMTSLVLAALVSGESLDLDVDVVGAAGMMHLKEVRDLVEEMPRARLHESVPDMAHLMASADLAVGACGMTALERCAAGVPSLVITIADNQVPSARSLARLRAVEYLGTHEEVTAQLVRESLWYATREPERIRRMAAAAHGVADGRGAGRVVQAMKEMS